MITFSNESNVKSINELISNIKNMKTQQITNIENGFSSIYSKLEEKKTELIAEF